MGAKLVEDMESLGKYPFSGHSAVMGKVMQDWQNSEKVLNHFGKQRGPALRGYRAFVARGIAQGQRPDLTGGGLIRSQGGWQAVKRLRQSGWHEKSDERILGDGAFVEKVLAQSQEVLERRYALQVQGVDLDSIAQLLNMKRQQVWLPGKYQQQVEARSLLCYWAVHELGFSMTSLAKRLGISTAAVSKSVRRGAAIAEDNSYTLLYSKQVRGVLQISQNTNKPVEGTQALHL